MTRPILGQQLGVTQISSATDNPTSPSRAPTFNADPQLEALKLPPHSVEAEQSVLG